MIWGYIALWSQSEKYEAYLKIKNKKKNKGLKYLTDYLMLNYFNTGVFIIKYEINY